MSQKSPDFFKVIVVGDFSVGKTSLIRRATDGVFTTEYKITIGVDFFLKKLKRKDKIVDLQLWDVAGHEKFGSCTRAYYRHAMGAFLVFDLTRDTTMRRLEEWKSSIDQNVTLANGESIPMILLANKCDVGDEISVTDEQIEAFAREHNFRAWFKTSAKNNINVEESMQRIAEEILSIDKEQFGAPPVDILQGLPKHGEYAGMSGNQNVPPDAGAPAAPQKRGCCT